LKPLRYYGMSRSSLLLRVEGLTIPEVSEGYNV